MTGKVRFLLASILTVAVCAAVLFYGFVGYEAAQCGTGPLETPSPDQGAYVGGEDNGAAEQGAPGGQRDILSPTGGANIPWEAGLAVFVALSSGIMLILFARLREEDVLDGLRGDIYEYIVQNPGAHLAGITRHFGISSSSTRHHLDVLEWGDRIVSHKSGKMKHYYPNRNGFRSYAGGLEYKEVLAALKNDTSRGMVKFLMKNDGANQKAVAAALGLHPSTVNWHARRLHSAGLVLKARSGKDIHYTLNRDMDIVKVIALIEGASS